jgi:hypothetical protein
MSQRVCGCSEFGAELLELTSQREPVISSRDFGQNDDNRGKMQTI